MILKSLYPVLFFIFFACVNGFSQNMQYHRIEAKVSGEKFRQLMKAGVEIDHYYYKDGHLIAELSDKDLLIFSRYNVPVTYLIKDLEKNYKLHNEKVDKDNLANPPANAVTVPTPVNFGNGGTYGSGTGAKHYNFQEMQNELDKMRLLYPDLITVKSSIGTTFQGRDIFMVKISDNPDVDEAEPEVYLNAVHHAREPISMTQLIFFMWHVLENYNSDKEIRHLVNSTEIYILPCVNPDGYVYNQTANNAGGSMWRKNRKPNGDGTFGVDNNRNYGYQWGGGGSSTSTNSETFRGPAPFSEAENIAIKNFINSRQFVSELNYHSYGDHCIYPYGYIAVNNNPEIPLFNQLSVFLTQDNGFDYGNCQATLSYIASGCAEDWAYGEQTTKGKMYGFTPEIGNSSDGFYPASSRTIPLCNSMVVMNKNLLKVSTKFAEVTTSAPATVSSLNGTIPFSIKNFSLLSATYTVTVNPLSAFVLTVDAPKTFSGMSIFQAQNNAFSYTLDPLTPTGTAIPFEIVLDNGLDQRKDTISISFTCAAPGNLSTSSITSSSANISWQSLPGSTNYYTSYKTASSSTWAPDALVSGTTSSLTGLNSSTSYNWRVRQENCNSWSATQNFTTLNSCGVPSPSANNITTNSFVISWTAIPGATSYTVQYRKQGNANWTSSTVSGTSKTITGLTPATMYEFHVNAICSFGTSAYSPIGLATTSTVTYCSSNGTNNTAEWIDYINIGTISRVSGKEPGGYINTGLSTNLIKNVNYTITFSAGFSGATSKEKWRLYVDNNGDGDFSDGSENLINTSKDGPGNFTATLKIPGNAIAGTTKMRVIMSKENISSACGSYNHGETEDYTINISAAEEEENFVSSKMEDVLKTAEIFTPQNNITATWDISVSPNPFRDIINVRFNEALTGIIIISLIDQTGKTVYTNLFNNSGKPLLYNVATNHLSHGLYLLRIQNGDKIKTIKLVK